MATAGPSLSVEQNDAGDYTVGVTVDGIFVPFFTKNGSYVDTRVQKGQAAKAAAKTKAKDDE